MKLKLTTKPQTAPDGVPLPSPADEAAAPTPTTASSQGPKLKFKLSAAAPSIAAVGQPAEPPKQKRKYTKKAKVDEDGNAVAPPSKGPKSKKRGREENGEDGSPAAKRKPKPTAKRLALVPSDDDNDDETIAVSAPVTVSAAPRPPPIRTGSLLKLKMKTNGAVQPPQRSGTMPVLKIKGVQGKPPPRPPGVGYDSEAEEAENDPAIESQFILRMQPGPDCDLLRTAIEEKTVGKPTGLGGTAVVFRFFDREGRRAIVQIQGRLYAACMVDLPCVIESMKSWNKKDWVKTADVCQMLLVLGRVQNEDEAKKFPLPREIDGSRHLYPHGLTPPMHYVRRRRFRPRQSYHQIEQTEAKVNAELDADLLAKQTGGSVTYDIIDENKADSDDETSDEDADGSDEDVAETTEFAMEQETPAVEEVEVDDAELGAMLEAGLLEEDEDGDINALFGGETVEVETPATAHDVAMHALAENAVPLAESAASTPQAVTSPDDDDDDDYDVESPEGDVVDAEETAAQEGREQNMAEVRELEQEITDAWRQYNTVNNILYKNKVKTKIDRLQTDLDLKKKALGIDEDGE